ncbi:MAG TPA: lasso peptide biosynthesis B2 protein [Bryobacteraceae bacterium]|nr:lasso peptide biosynthesis B2 protein [Bryobacteraceae bacterium]
MRRLIRKFRTIALLSHSEKRQAASAILLMSCVRIVLWTVPFRVLKRMAETSRFSLSCFPAFSEERIVWAVRLACRYVPKASCLTQALTAQILLNRAELENRLHIGVFLGNGSAAAGYFESHAWIECQGRVLVGGAENTARYATILTLESERKP